ncbi:MAG TPA: GIY-YIG nuclease family protein [Methanotrichaceae archaeon]|nr:GIY-YIG nuclease family protein [Methanotrichaceae archaeon]
MPGGIYTLLLRLDATKEIGIGALGRTRFHEGYYAYTGSARSSSGWRRIARHIEIIDGIRTARRWHIDYLLPHTTLEGLVATSTTEDLECSIADMIGLACRPYIRFGCSDCRCNSHLHYSEDLGDLKEAVCLAHLRAGRSAKRTISER